MSDNGNDSTHDYNAEVIDVAEMSAAIASNLASARSHSTRHQ